MKKTALLFVILFTLIGSSTFAQGNYSIENGPQFWDLMNTVKDNQGVITDLEGSAYLNEEWQKSVIKTKDDENFEVNARYRYYDNTIEVKRNTDKDIYVLGKSFIKSITIGLQHFITLDYTTENGESTAGFFELLTNGELYLLVQYDKVITPAIKNGYQSTPGSIKENRKFFIYDNDKKKMVVYNKISKKSIMPLFGEYSKEVENYAKKNKLNFKKIKELAKILEYYDSKYRKKSSDK